MQEEAEAEEEREREQQAPECDSRRSYGSRRLRRSGRTWPDSRSPILRASEDLR